jgi:hypothetical protein
MDPEEVLAWLERPKVRGAGSPSRREKSWTHEAPGERYEVALTLGSDRG